MDPNSTTSLLYNIYLEELVYIAETLIYTKQIKQPKRNRTCYLRTYLGDPMVRSCTDRYL